MKGNIESAILSVKLKRERWGKSEFKGSVAAASLVYLQNSQEDKEEWVRRRVTKVVRGK